MIIKIIGKKERALMVTVPFSFPQPGTGAARGLGSKPAESFVVACLGQARFRLFHVCPVRRNHARPDAGPVQSTRQLQQHAAG